MPNDSPESCGSSCMPCPSPPGAVATCDGTSCGVECAPGSEEACRGRAVALGLGLAHSCAVLSDTTMRCWGGNDAGQVGDGSLAPIVSAPAEVQGLIGARAVVGGDQHSCALMNDGSVYCWGANTDGQLGIGSTSVSFTPERVLGLRGAVALSAGRRHTCAILGDDTVRCWGANDLGQLGTGTLGGDGSLPLVVGGLSGRAIQIGATPSGACVLLVGGTVECWGSSSGSSVAVRALEAQNVALLGTGSGPVCVAFSDGTVSCNLTSRVGNGISDAGARAMPELEEGLDGKRCAGLASGERHTCMLDDGGGISCWGGNFYGQVGDVSSAADHPTAYSVPGLSGIVALAAGARHNCVIAGDGSVSCWGINGTAELGTGNDAITSAVPTRVQGW